MRLRATHWLPTGQPGLRRDSQTGMLYFHFMLLSRGGDLGAIYVILSGVVLVGWVRDPCRESSKYLGLLPPAPTRLPAPRVPA